MSMRDDIRRQARVEKHEPKIPRKPAVKAPRTMRCPKPRSKVLVLRKATP